MSKLTNIALLAPYNVYPPQTGGKKFIALFYEYLRKIQPVEFISVAKNDMPSYLQDSFHGILGDTKLRYINPLLFFSLKKLIRQKKITDLIIVHPYYGWLAWLLKKNTGTKISVLSHNIESMRFKSMGKSWWRLLWQYEKFTHRITDNNFFVTEEDRQFAIKQYKLSPAKCHVITYGTELSYAPSEQETSASAVRLRQLYGIADDEKILLFNGSLNYLPNTEAIDFILQHINPELMRATHYRYKIIICGKGLPSSYNELRDYADKNIIYAGFVDDIDLFFKGADVFLNPVICGGGIKTKLVEALANGLNAVSTATGAFGVPVETANEKLFIVKDYDWRGFAEAIKNAEKPSVTGAAFFNHFYWGNIAAKAAGIINGQPYK